MGMLELCHWGSGNQFPQHIIHQKYRSLYLKLSLLLFQYLKLLIHWTFKVNLSYFFIKIKEGSSYICPIEVTYWITTAFNAHVINPWHYAEIWKINLLVSPLLLILGYCWVHVIVQLLFFTVNTSALNDIMYKILSRLKFSKHRICSQYPQWYNCTLFFCCF